MTDKPTALRLADALENGSTYDVGSSVAYGWIKNDPTDEAAAELRRLHAVNADLLEALHAMLSHTAMLDPSQGYDGCDHSAVNQARTAIAKAEGSQP